MKKEWKKAKLLFLCRSKAEETVLTSCKGWPNTGENNVHWACAVDCTPTGCFAIQAS